MRVTWMIVSAMLASALTAGCREAVTEEAPRPVRYVVAAESQDGGSERLTGQIAAHHYVNVSFRIAGKIADRFVSAGDAVAPGKVLARLDDAVVRDTLLAAKADVAAAQAALVQADKQARRVENLVAQGAVSRSENDLTVRQRTAAVAQLDAAQAKRHQAEEQLGYATMRSEVSGVVVSRLAERGEVVNAGQPVFRIAENKGWDAVFDMPESLVRDGLAMGQKLSVCLDGQRDVCAEASIYEIAPEADTTTRTYQTKALLGTHPDAMLLGATVVGHLVAPGKTVVALPASALSKRDGKPSVWIIDAAHTVSSRPVEVARYGTDTVMLSGGVKPGERVVTAGVQTLRPGQKVRDDVQP